MSIVAFAGNIKVTSVNKKVILKKEPDNYWGDPWPSQGESMTVDDVDGLIRALQQVQNERRKEW